MRKTMSENLETRIAELELNGQRQQQQIATLEQEIEGLHQQIATISRRMSTHVQTEKLSKKLMGQRTTPLIRR